MPYEVATTGVEGLVTIIPVAGIASWYDYTNSQGVATIFDVNYADNLSSFNCGAAFLDESFENLDTGKDSEEIDYDYSYVIDNEAIQVRIPVAEEGME